MEFAKTVITVAGCVYLGLIALALFGLAVATLATIFQRISNGWKPQTNRKD